MPLILLEAYVCIKYLHLPRKFRHKLVRAGTSCLCVTDGQRIILFEFAVIFIPRHNLNIFDSRIDNSDTNYIDFLVQMIMRAYGRALEK